MSDAEAKVTLINDDMNNMVAATEEIAASTATAFNEVTEFCQGTEKIAELTEKNTELAKKINNISGKIAKHSDEAKDKASDNYEIMAGNSRQRMLMQSLLKRLMHCPMTYLRFLIRLIFLQLMQA